MADKLSAFEVFPDRELKVRPPDRGPPGRASVRSAARGRRDYDAPYDPRFGKAMVKTLSTWRRRWARRSATPSAPSCRCTRWPTAATRAACLSRIAGEASGKLSLSRRGGDVRGAPVRIPVEREAQEYFRWRQEEANVHLDRSLLHARAVAVGRRRDRGAAHPRRARARREGRALAPERARLRATCRRGSGTARSCASSRPTRTATRPAASSST